MGNLTVKTGNIAGNLTKFFQTSQMHQDLPGGMGGFGFGRYIMKNTFSCCFLFFLFALLLLLSLLFSGFLFELTNK